jgi:RNA polymerase sigma-70 factor (ECF subfamily)
MWAIDDEVENVVVDLSSDLDTGHQIEMSETSEIVSYVLSKMPKAYGLTLSLFYLEDNSVKEIAEITGLNDSNVKVMLFRARKMFKELMTKTYPELYKEELI